MPYNIRATGLFNTEPFKGSCDARMLQKLHKKQSDIFFIFKGTKMSICWLGYPIDTRSFIVCDEVGKKTINFSNRMFETISQAQEAIESWSSEASSNFEHALTNSSNLMFIDNSRENSVKWDEFNEGVKSLLENLKKDFPQLF